MTEPTIKKPSKRYIKHGYLGPSENYDQNIHFSYNRSDPYYNNYFNRVDERNRITYEDKFYNNEEIEQMKSEIKEAECPICLEKINNQDILNNNCASCSKGHKFHYNCNETQTTPVITCPICRDRNIQNCENKYDIFSGGIKYIRKKTGKRRKNKSKRRKNTSKRRKPNSKTRK
jgi:predicted RNase H-like nuclease (RuvC/YqgF family)